MLLNDLVSRTGAMTTSSPDNPGGPNTTPLTPLVALIQTFLSFALVSYRKEGTTADRQLAGPIGFIPQPQS